MQSRLHYNVRRQIGRFSKTLLHTCGFKIERITLFDRLINLLLQEDNDYFVLQVGAYDGISNDLLYKYIMTHDLPGLIIEPQTPYFNIAKRFYSGCSRIILENVAISERNGIRSFFSVTDEHKHKSQFSAQMSTLRKDVLLKHKYEFGAKEDEFVKEEKVQTVHLRELIAKHSITNLDIAVIDTEGYDFEIIKQIFELDLRPRLLLFEHKHLSQLDRNKAKLLLTKRNYKTKSNGKYDTLAYQ